MNLTKKTALDQTWIYWTFAFIVLAGCLYFVFAVGFKSKAIPKMKLSHFDHPEVYSDALTLRLWQELQAQPILILGIESGFKPALLPQVTDGDSEIAALQKPADLTAEKKLLFRKLASRIILKSQEEKYKFDVILVDSRLGDFQDLPMAQYLDFFAQRDSLLALLDHAVKNQQRVLLLTTELDSSHLIEGNFIGFLKSQNFEQFNSITLLDFPMNREAELQMTKPCVVHPLDQTVTGKLGCEIVTQSRMQYLKIAKETKDYLGFASQVASRFYLAFFGKRQ